VTDMHDMFDSDTQMKKLNLSNLNTSKVTNMSNMFYGCSNLEELNLS
jgi:surface protein